MEILIMQEKEWNKYLEKYKVEYQMQNEIRKKESGYLYFRQKRN